MDNCPICLDPIKKGDITKKFSCDCNYVYHFSCYRSMVYNKGNMFVKCPTCREMNTDVSIPFKDDYKKSILLMSNPGVTKVRCIHITKGGTRCKLKSNVLNQGFCHIHNKDVLKKQHYELMCKWMYYLFQTNYKWSSMLYLIDFGKKMIIHKLDKDKNIEDILYHLYLYLNKNLQDNSGKQHNMNGVFKYYGFDEPTEGWITYCEDNKTII